MTSLTDNREAQAECRRELENWGRWGHPDDDPLGYQAMSIWELVEASKAFDGSDPFVPPTDELLAIKTDAIICSLGQRWPSLKKTLVLHYHGQKGKGGEWRRLKQPFHKLRIAEQAFWDMR